MAQIFHGIISLNLLSCEAVKERDSRGHSSTIGHIVTHALGVRHIVTHCVSCLGISYILCFQFFSITFLLKMDLTILFTHLKIILLQCFQLYPNRP